MVSPSAGKHLVGAHYGLGGWLAQRLTAVVMLVYTLLLLVIVLWHGGLDYAQWLALFQRQSFRIATFLFMLALVYHTWVGMRNITMDYIKPLAVRLALQTAIMFTLLGYVGWTISVLWG
ncbi:MAG TPA: succinate dehydrogenase, hydrophobic membrane anchor protein [Casimicrobiaceae bacterium]|nr:succinate dehydrogenase, hydrophobic membrane anchor protein [Casimicrobiaceae bacterium]